MSAKQGDKAGQSEYFVHESSYLDEGAQVGAGTKIWHFSHVSKGASIGERCSIGQNVFVAPGVQIGHGVKIQNNVSVYEGVILEDYVFCGPSMVFTNVKTPRSEFPRNTSDDYTPTIVKRGASIGANATVVTGITLHEGAFVAAGAVVTRDVPAYTIVAGVPAKAIGYMSASGDVLDFSSGDTVTDSTGHTYQRISETEIKRLS
ncbi:acyltransferase [Deinococcus radiophilus]|uniref:N-acetyltransferase n=1 Tax=Deinococcus radiophilus TaxID=32062 RepID=A0A3S0L6B2_9DEIO|nr:acyltransferase [Deinococcus radiophilus]RTR28046.1 N-acetyltransferase [Deinococcus radiophilus]UFA51500.1 N-acetyltransferase [Deinococcus radiophilus]